MVHVSIYTRLLFGFNFVSHAERFHRQNGSARRTAPHAERFRTQNRFPFGLRCGLYSQLLANVATHPNGKSPPFFDPPPLSWGARARPEGPSPRAMAPARGQKKGGTSPIWVRSHLKMGTPHKWEKPNTHKNYRHTYIFTKDAVDGGVILPAYSSIWLWSNSAASLQISIIPSLFIYRQQKNLLKAFSSSNIHRSIAEM